MLDFDTFIFIRTDGAVDFKEFPLEAKGYLKECPLKSKGNLKEFHLEIKGNLKGLPFGI